MIQATIAVRTIARIGLSGELLAVRAQEGGSGPSPLPSLAVITAGTGGTLCTRDG